MAIDDKIRDEKLQYNINRRGAKASLLSPGETDKCESYGRRNTTS